jgi:succinate dehydrogenase/fumarate reductase flavoprotein subunit
MMVTVAGAGMAGLVAARRLRELGVEVALYEAGTRPGGSMLLSSGVVWRHRTTAEALRDCSEADPALVRLVVDRLDEALAWLERIAPPTAAGTGNPDTVGRRFEARALTRALTRGAAAPQLGARVFGLERPVVLATGGYAARLADEQGLLPRCAPWNVGDGIRLAAGEGAALRGARNAFYGRALPAPPARVPEAHYVDAAQLYGRVAHVVDDEGRPLLDGPPSWSEADLAWMVADRAGGRAWFVLDADGETASPRGRPVAEMVELAERLGGEVRRSPTLTGLGLGAIAAPGLRRPPFLAVHVAVGVTHTYRGVRIDCGARALDERGLPIPGLYVAGVDAGGLFDGGYASGLAAALVLGLCAAESAATDL